MRTLACSKCGVVLEVRPMSAQTPEQKWCGTWYDHPQGPRGECLNSTGTSLVPSAALLASNAQQQLPITALDDTP